MANLLPVLLLCRTADTELGAVADRSAAQMSGENFPVALRFLPRAARDDLARVYRFARFVDDVGDETAGGPEHRLALLDAVATDLRELDGGHPGLQPVADLRPLVRRGVPVQPFLDLVEANRVDQRVSEYETFDDLLGYCRLSAAPVGRLVLHVARAATERNVADSDGVCAALQVLEHCQDVGEDARAGRVYLPASELRVAGVQRADLTGTATPDALRGVVAQQVARSRQLLRSGRPLVRRLHGWARLAVAGYVAGGLATADALENRGYAVLDSSIRPAKSRTAGHAARQLIPW